MIPPQRMWHMVAKMHRIHIPNVGEAVLHIPGGEPYEYYDSEKWPIGTYARFGGKGYMFAGVGGSGITHLQHGAKSDVRQPVGWSTIAETVAAGVKQVTVDLDGSAGPEGDGNLPKDYLKGGEICMMPVWGTGFTRHIAGNSLVEGGLGGTFTVDFGTPTPILLTVDIAHAECIPSIYKGISATNTGDAKNPVVGMPTLVTPSGKFCWLQVEGPFGIAAQGDVGEADYKLQAVFRPDGTIGPHDIDAGNDEKPQQHAGYIMFLSLTGAQGTPFIMLQIAH